ncbi:cytochrome p450 oxidoreductase [Diaporthe amygdali]|uniref:cytochrome p450 oxidoreductase n=1 Tax=Phomopsis amygdali TaxID=1214568 RepID=UPI0022FE56D6|nr:cytochrome p450 oxidoreductase [Diaporthe amygdali]KAJ0104237.1 cytochrome p450 oxidoreductase [Diaporthe amygdali]
MYAASSYTSVLSRASTMHSSLLWVGGLLLFLLIVAIRRRYTPYLRDVPAISVLATISRWEYVRQILTARMERNLLEAHRRLVRIAHNEISIADPAAIPIIYDTEQKWVKTDWYYMFGFPDPKNVNTFSVMNPVEHKRMKRNVAPTYSMSALLELEPSVDSTLTMFLQRLDEAAVSPTTPVSERGPPTDLAQWLTWLAADVIGELSFSRRLGFLDTMSDVGDTAKTVDSFIAYASAVAIVPAMHKFLFGNPIIPYLIKVPSLIIADVTNEEVQKRRDAAHEARADIMGRIMESQKIAGPERFPPSELLNMAAVNVTAGSDTTAIGMHSLIYYLLKHPLAMEKLQVEITEADRLGNLSKIPRYRETNHKAMPYLAACIKETFRIHPAVTISLPRHVPAGGAYICGQFFPAGTRVGVSPYVVGRDPKLFGEDADKFRPERWTECSYEQLIAMEHGCLHFGHGSRVCLGRHIAMLEITKVIVAVFRDFHLELAAPDEEWQISTYNVPKPKSINVWIHRREHKNFQTA